MTDAQAHLTDNERKVIEAMRSPRYHREVFCRSALYWPQEEAIKLVEKHMAAKSGKTITIRACRQTMKNECAATIHARALARYRIKGGIIVRTAPTYRPQIVNSKMRLEKMARIDPFIFGRLERKEGYIYTNGNAQIQFLSAQDRTNVEGATASLLLDIDEAHKIDKGKFEEAFAPMAAWENVPVVMWGVAADKEDLLYEYRMHNEDRDPALNLQYNCDVWSELRPQYARHVEERKQKLGESHPVFLTQYKLVDIESTSGFLRADHIESILASDHERQAAPRDGASYVCVIDIGGEDDEGEVQSDKGRAIHDATVCFIAEVDHTDRVYDYPKFRIVQCHYWVGKAFGSNVAGQKGQQELLLDILNRWKPSKTVIDGRGIGSQMAHYLYRRAHGIEIYSASATTVSEDCYKFLGLVNNDRVKMWQNDQSAEWNQAVAEMRHTKYEIFNHDQMKIIKPPSGGHIDMVKALTYLSHCLKRPFIMKSW